MLKRLASCLKLALIAAMLLGSIHRSNGQASSAPQTTRVDHLFAQWSVPDTPGCSVAVSRGNEMLYEHGYGMASIELGVPISPGTVFHAASVSKIFTAEAILILAQRGKLSLDDEVQKYLPEFPEYSRKLTIRHLLSHTGGLRDVFELQALAAPAPASHDPNDQFVNLLAHQRGLNFEPGSEWQYSNGSYLLLATIVKRVSGMSLRDFTESNIFGPLGMKNTRFHDDPAELIPNRASGYSPADSGPRVAINSDPGGIVGNAGLYTTARDLLRWAASWDRASDRAPLDAMAKPTTLHDGTKMPYGLGLELGEYDGVHIVGHSGGNAGFAARVARYQEQKLGVAILCNRDDVYNVGALTDEVAEIYLAGNRVISDEPKASAPATSIQLAVQDLEGKEGLYQNPSNQQLFRIFLNGGRLMANIVGRTNAWELTPVTSDRFTFLGGLVSLEFLPKTHGKVQEIRVTDNETPKPFLIHRVDPWVPTSSDLRFFEGNYKSTELGVIYAVVAKDSGLRIQIPGRDEVLLLPVAADTFAGDLVGVVKFIRDERQSPSSFTVNTMSVRGLLFSRLAASGCKPVM